jgi:5-methylcytosine-specific restriction endonuclease McrA
MSKRNSDPHGINAAWKQWHADRRLAMRRAKTGVDKLAVAKRFAGERAKLIASVKAKKRQRRREIPRWKKGVPFNVWYPVYLRSPHWKRTRAAALKRAKSKCEECGSVDRLEVHHLTYVNLRQELPEDLRVLCRGCHEHAHGLDQRDSITVEFLRLNLDRN